MELRGLNDKQLEAVKATEGKVRIIAGAGSGKTRGLAYRYAYLVDVLGIDPGNILCLTFTNKAAQEMRNRSNHLICGEHASDFICTIHSFCVKFLREEIDAATLQYIHNNCQEKTYELFKSTLVRQRKYLSLDFEDLIAFTLHILQNFPDVRAKWQRKMNYVMVDQVQDFAHSRQKN